jgi:nitrite reductase/ring-hydroxylating ferredoxin subunit/uncharacterized membrane protein
MVSEALMVAIGKQPALDQIADKLQPAINEMFSGAGEGGQQVKNFLHGTWLGHPLHPALTDVPIGAWTTALALDGMEAVNGSNGFGRAADAAIAIGFVGAMGAAMSGATDWASTEGRARKIGLVHGLLNVGASALYLTSLVMRTKNRRKAGVGLAMLGFAVSSASAYLGGHLVYGERVGVNRAVIESPPEDFVAVMDDSELEEGKLKRVEVQDIPVLLVRRHGEICALAETCSHLGGPLSEGEFDGDNVKCPWHGSMFSVVDGSVVNGPASFPQPCFETRVREGKIEIKSKTES